MGEILIAGIASLLLCIFLGPKFIRFLREKEFGQHIREEGPEGHHGKAGTPTMGGLVIFAAVAVPFLSLGVSARSKLVAQMAIAIALWLVATRLVKLDQQLSLWVVDASIEIPTWIY